MATAGSGRLMGLSLRALESSGTAADRGLRLTQEDHERARPRTRPHRRPPQPPPIAQGSHLRGGVPRPRRPGPNVAVRVLDVSATGACLVLSESFPAGRLIGVALYGTRSLLPVACAASVVWSKDAGDGTFVTGVQFAREAGVENLAAVARPDSPRG